MRAILYPSEISGRVAAPPAAQKHGTPCAHLRGAGQRRKPRVEPFRLAGYHGNACRHAPCWVRPRRIWTRRSAGAAPRRPMPIGAVSALSPARAGPAKRNGRPALCAGVRPGGLLRKRQHAAVSHPALFPHGRAGTLYRARAADETPQGVYARMFGGGASALRRTQTGLRCAARCLPGNIRWRETSAASSSAGCFCSSAAFRRQRHSNHASVREPQLCGPDAACAGRFRRAGRVHG